jgi:hypothetical protein
MGCEIKRSAEGFFDGDLQGFLDGFLLGLDEGFFMETCGLFGCFFA